MKITKEQYEFIRNCKNVKIYFTLPGSQIPYQIIFNVEKDLGESIFHVESAIHGGIVRKLQRNLDESRGACSTLSLLAEFAAIDLDDAKRKLYVITKIEKWAHERH